MHTTLNEMGSMVLDIFGNRLDAVFLDSNITIRDRFSIVHEPDQVSPVIYSVKILNSAGMQILFSEPLDKKSVENVTHYSINNGIQVFSATRSVDGRSV